ncbi:amidase [Tistlia consotensis]|nr:amidase [Tistlia consotensis]
MTDVTRLPVVELRDRLAAGALSALEVAEGFLARCEAVEPEVRAFAFLDPEHVRAQARRLDEHRKSGRPLGRLHGLPVALKDTIDTADMPTENGTAVDKGRRPEEDAVAVSRLRQAGALIFGKTVTTELAYFAPGPTRNPHDLERTPGGSSQGSAAAVAAGMAPLAVGTQTAGSVIRPAAFCGIVGFKPSFGLIPRSGVLTQCRELDTLGTFARDLEGAALLAEGLQGHDEGDPDTRPLAALPLLSACGEMPPYQPLFAFVRGPTWDQAAADTVEAFAELAGALGEIGGTGPDGEGICDEVELPEEFAEGIEAQLRLQHVGIARNYGHYLDRHGELMSPVLRQAVEQGRALSAIEFLNAKDWAAVLRDGLDRLFERYDAILTPAAPGEAPRDLAITGKPAFNALWTLLGLPAVTLPLLAGENGMPLGVQLVGRKGEDERLLRTAAWLQRSLTADDASTTTREAKLA